jgi:predicted transcriptional regulator
MNALIPQSDAIGSLSQMSFAVEIQLNEQQQVALERVARRRKVSLPRVLKNAVDDFIARLEEEELLESSARQAQRKPWQEEDAVALVRAWRRKQIEV